MRPVDFYDEIAEHYDSLSAKHGYKVIPPHDEIIMLGKFLRKDPNRLKDAIELLQMNIANYPTSAIASEQLGDTYAVANDTSNATTYYQKALALDPANETLKKKLNPAK